MPTTEIAKWKRISLAIALIVVVRGVFVLCVLPPFEGWDEFSHIAYVVYLRETAELPQAESSKTPASMAPMVRGYPHPCGSWLLIGFCPLFVTTAARISNDALAIFFSSLTSYFLIRALTVDPRRARWFAFASVFLGLGLATKANVMAMIPPVAASICWLTYRKE